MWGVDVDAALVAFATLRVALSEHASRHTHEVSEVFLQATLAFMTGLQGVRQAMTVLRDYHASDAAVVQQPELPAMRTAAAGAGTRIVGRGGRVGLCHGAGDRGVDSG